MYERVKCCPLVLVRHTRPKEGSFHQRFPGGSHGCVLVDKPSKWTLRDTVVSAMCRTEMVTMKKIQRRRGAEDTPPGATAELAEALCLFLASSPTWTCTSMAPGTVRRAQPRIFLVMLVHTLGGAASALPQPYPFYSTGLWSFATTPRTSR